MIIIPEDQKGKVQPPNYQPNPSNAEETLALAVNSTSFPNGSRIELNGNGSVYGGSETSSSGRTWSTRQPPPVHTLTWTPPASSQPNLTSASSAHIPFGNPPGYNASRTPNKAVKYSFSQLSFNSMILVPPADHPDTRPLYHISITHNCFQPFSFITTVRRGATDSGDHVADFEMGISSKDATVTMNGEEVYLNRKLSKRGSHARGIWAWNMTSGTIVWNCEGVVDHRFCYRPDDKKTILAKFYPAKQLRKRGQPVQISQLEILPEGYNLFDQILVSALIVERQRLTPGGTITKIKELFNYRQQQYMGEF